MIEQDKKFNKYSEQNLGETQKQGAGIISMNTYRNEQRPNENNPQNQRIVSDDFNFEIDRDNMNFIKPDTIKVGQATEIARDRQSQSTGLITEQPRQQPTQNTSEEIKDRPSKESSDEYYLEPSNGTEMSPEQK